MLARRYVSLIYGQNNTLGMLQLLDLHISSSYPGALISAFSTFLLFVPQEVAKNIIVMFQLFDPNIYFCYPVPQLDLLQQTKTHINKE